MLTFLLEIMGLASALQIVSISGHPLVCALFLKVMVKKNSHGNVLNLLGLYYHAISIHY